MWAEVLSVWGRKKLDKESEQVLKDGHPRKRLWGEVRLKGLVRSSLEEHSEEVTMRGKRDSTVVWWHCWDGMLSCNQIPLCGCVCVYVFKGEPGIKQYRWGSVLKINGVKFYNRNDVRERFGLKTSVSMSVTRSGISYPHNSHLTFVTCDTYSASC